jgi:hypothetical protein
MTRNNEHARTQFTEKVGKYVGEGHVKTGEHHWRKGGETETNALQDT